MTWVKDRLEAKAKAQQDWGTINAHAVQTYEQLWEEVHSLVTEAIGLGMPATTNGNQLARAVYMPAKVKRGQLPQSRELVLTLHRDRHVVTAKADIPEFMLNLDLSLCDDGVVCLKHDGEQVSLEQAAKLVLEPFLFPPDEPLFG